LPGSEKTSPLVSTPPLNPVRQRRRAAYRFCQPLLSSFTLSPSFPSPYFASSLKLLLSLKLFPRHFHRPACLAISQSFSLWRAPPPPLALSSPFKPRGGNSHLFTTPIEKAESQAAVFFQGFFIWQQILSASLPSFFASGPPVVPAEFLCPSPPCSLFPAGTDLWFPLRIRTSPSESLDLPPL